MGYINFLYDYDRHDDLAITIAQPFLRNRLAKNVYDQLIISILILLQLLIIYLAISSAFESPSKSSESE